MSARLGLVAAAIMAAISAIHVYWAAVGPADYRSFVPEVDGKPAFTPGPISTLGVAVALAAASATIAVAAAQSGRDERSVLARRGALLLALVFGARAIGDFRTIGFSKRVRGTRFAKMDTAVYSPLCSFLSICCAAVAR